MPSASLPQHKQHNQIDIRPQFPLPEDGVRAPGLGSDQVEAVAVAAMNANNALRGMSKLFCDMTGREMLAMTVNASNDFERGVLLGLAKIRAAGENDTKVLAIINGWTHGNVIALSRLEKHLLRYSIMQSQTQEGEDRADWVASMPYDLLSLVGNMWRRLSAMEKMRCANYCHQRKRGDILREICRSEGGKLITPPPEPHIGVGT